MIFLIIGPQRSVDDTAHNTAVANDNCAGFKRLNIELLTNWTAWTCFQVSKLKVGHLLRVLAEGLDWLWLGFGLTDSHYFHFDGLFYCFGSLLSGE